MAYTFGVLPTGTQFSEMGYEYEKTGSQAARRLDDGEEYEFHPDQVISPSGDLDDLPDLSQE